jgi:hypothetical protein
MDRLLVALAIAIGVMLGGGIVAFAIYQVWAVRNRWGSDL